MRLCCHALLSLAALLCLAAGGRKEAKPGDADTPPPLQGRWEVIAYQQGGEPKRATPGIRVMITSDSVTFAYPDRRKPVSFKYRADATKDPKQIDCITETDGGRTVTQPGIYEVTDNILRLCIAPAGRDRPEAFASTTPGDVDTVWVLRRLKGDGNGKATAAGPGQASDTDRGKLVRFPAKPGFPLAREGGGRQGAHLFPDLYETRSPARPIPKPAAPAGR